MELSEQFLFESSAKRSLPLEFNFISKEVVRNFIARLGPEFTELVGGVGTLSVDVLEQVEIVSLLGVQCTESGLPVRLSRIVLKSNGHFVFEVLHAFSEHGQCDRTLDSLVPYLRRMLRGGVWKYCPGVENYAQRFGQALSFQPVGLRRWGFPFTRTDSRGCNVLFELSKNASLEAKFKDVVMCQHCKTFERQLNVLKEKAISRAADPKQPAKGKPAGASKTKLRPKKPPADS